MRKILFLDNAANARYDARKHIVPYLSLPYDVVKSDVDSIPENLGGYSHLIIGGSMADSYDGEWQSRVYDLIRVSINDGKPILGICFGHQVIVRTLYGEERVVQKPTCDIGWEEIEVLRDDFLLGKKGSKRMVFAFHGFEVANVPGDIDVIARSERCEIMAYKFRGKPVWGVQPHFEIDVLQGRELIEEFKDCGMPLFPMNVDYVPSGGTRHNVFERFLSL